MAIIDNLSGFKGVPANCNPSAFDANRVVICNNFSTSNPIAGLVMKDIKKQNQFVLLYL